MDAVDAKCVNTLRFLAVDAVERAKSGHPGLPLGAAPMAYALFDRLLKHDPADRAWPDRDRFILSAGHGSALLYAMLHLSGYGVSLADLQAFRQWGSITPGHPEHGLTPGVEATTGPLGQGFAMGVGMAIAERHLAAEFNRPDLPIVDHATYAIVSDGDLMEGISSEAASLAGTLGLGKLVYLYDDNHVSLEGPTSWAFTEDVPARFAAYGWHVERIADGNDIDAIAAALNAARQRPDRPSLLAVRTHLGYGSPVQDTREAHGEPLGPAATVATKQKLGWPTEPPFLVPDDVRARFDAIRARGARDSAAWRSRFDAYRARYPDDARRFLERLAGTRPAGWDAAVPTFAAADGAVATRDASQKTVNALAATVPALLGGAADLSPSTKTSLTGAPDFSAADGGGRNLHYGVREHAMIAAMNGLALHGGILPYGGTFLTFSDYARGSIRLAALQQTHVILVFTHDSIAMGEDGPTHQPVEHLAGLRAVPGLSVVRPADANETAIAWKDAVERAGPTALVLTRQKVPVIDVPIARLRDGVPRGAYVVRDPDRGPPDVVLLATGSEVSVALDAARLLGARGVAARVVSMPSWDRFDQQPESYRRSVLPADVPRVSVEAAATFGWARYVGDRGVSIGVDRFGASAPGPTVLRELGITPEHVADAATQLLPARARP